MTASLDLADLADRADDAPSGKPRGLAVYALLRFRRLVGAAALVGALIGLGYGLMRPNSYTSAGTLLLRSGARETETAETAVAGRASQVTRPYDVIANEIEILSHRDTFLRVVEAVGISRILEVYDPAAEDSAETPPVVRSLHNLQSWWFATSSRTLETSTPVRREALALESLMKNLELRAAGSSLIRVSYEAHTPELAKEVADAFLAAAEERHRQVFTNRTSLEFLKTVEEEARKAAKAANETLQAFKREHRVYDPEVQRGHVLTEIQKLESQIAGDAEALREHQSRRDSLEAKLKAEPPLQDVMVDGLPQINPEYAYLQQAIFALKTDRLTVESRASDKLERAQRLSSLDKLIASTEERLNGAQLTIPGPKSRQPAKNLHYEWLRTQLDTSELAIVALQSVVDWRKTRVVELRNRLESLEQLWSQYDVLNAQVARHEGDSRRFIENLRNIELLNLLDEHKLSNLQILEAADLPINKTGPNRARAMLLGAACGFILGLCLAFVRQGIDGAVRRREDLESMGVELLGVVPETTEGSARQLGKGATLSGANEEVLRHHLNALWAAVVPAARLRDPRTTVALVGDEGSPGVTTLAVHVAVRSARYLHQKVLLIETNCHRASLAARLGLGDVPGLADLLAGTASRGEVVLQTSVPGLSIVHAGSPEACLQGMKAGQRPEDVLRSLSEGFQIVLLDVPSIVEHPELGPFAWYADHAIAVCGAGQSTKLSVRRLLHAIESAGKGPPAVVLNRWRSVRPKWLPASLQV